MLRDYQENAIAASDAALARGMHSQVVALATGLGKTHVAGHIIKRRPGRALFLAPLDEIVGQSARRIFEIIPERSIGVVKAGIKQYHADVVVGSVQTLSREGNLSRVTPDFTTVVVDECHLMLDGYKKIVSRLKTEDALVLGLSATPYRLDGRGLEEVFEEIVFEMGIAEGIEREYLSEIEGYRFRLEGADFSKVHTRRGDLEAKELEAVMKAANFDEHITRKWLEHASDRHTVVFLPKVAMAYQLAEHMRSQGIRASALDGTTDMHERREILRRYNGGDIQVLVNVLCLSTGWDSPITDCLIMARPTKSKALYVQALGRGLRPNPPVKRNCLVLDMVGTTQRHSDLLSLASLTGVRRMKEGESFTQAKLRAAVEARETQRQKHSVGSDGAERLEVELAAHRVDILRPDQSQDSRKFQKKQVSFHWKIGIDNKRSLELKDRVVVVRPMADESWIASDNCGWRFIGSSPEDCQRAGEEHARKLTREPGWRGHPATDSQLHKLRVWRIRHSPGITKGQASDLIGAWMNRRKGRAA